MGVLEAGSRRPGRLVRAAKAAPAAMQRRDTVCHVRLDTQMAGSLASPTGGQGRDDAPLVSQN